jgi:hypothetical protein
MIFRCLLLLVFCISHQLKPALSPETLIQTPLGFVEIQHLRSGDTVSGIDLKSQKKIISKIREVQKYLVASRTKITTDKKIFTVSDDQLMRVERAPPERAQIVDSDPEDCFVAAQNLRVGDRLQTYDGNYQTITNIERIKPTQTQTNDTQLFRAQAHSFAECAIFYGLHLDEPHHFYATEQNIFMHNFAAAIPLGAELVSMVCALGVGAAGSYLSPSNSGFNMPAFQVPATVPASSVNNFTPFRFDQLPAPAGELSAFSIRSSGNFNDHSFLFSGAQSTRLSILPAGNFIHQYPDLTWTFNGLMGFDGNLLFKAIAQKAETETAQVVGIFRGHRHDPYLKHLVSAHDAALARELEHYFNDLSDAQFELLASQTGCYDDKTTEVQTALAAVDLTYAGSRFASTVVYVCKQENISLSAIMHTINHGTKASSVYRLSPNYKVYESTENKLKVLTYEKPFSTVSILGVSDLDGFVQVPRDATALETYYTWREKKLVERQHAEATRKKHNRDALRAKNIAEYQTKCAQRPTKLEPLKQLCPKPHCCAKGPTGHKNLALSRSNMEYGFSIDTFHFSPLAADFAIKNNLNFDDFLDWLPPHNVRQFRQERMLKFGYWKAKEIAFLYECNSRSFSSMFFCPPDAVAAVMAAEESECDFDENAIRSWGDRSLPDDAPSSCGTGKLKNPFPEPPPPVDDISNRPEVTCGGTPAQFPNSEKGGCGTGSQKEPKPKESCNWSQGHNLPAFGGTKEIGETKTELGEEIKPAEDEPQKPSDEKEPPTDSHRPSAEKTADEPGAKARTEAVGEAGVDSECGSIIEAGSTDVAVAEAPAKTIPRPTDLERIDGNTDKQEHLMYGSKGSDHQLEIIIGEVTWEKTRALIKDIMETGEVGKKLPGRGKCKFKYFGKNPVVVTYGENGDIDGIGSVFIPVTEERTNRYIPEEKQQ